MKPILLTSLGLNAALLAYARFIEHSNTDQILRTLTKEDFTEQVFDMARRQFGSNLIYAERIAGSFFFHIKISSAAKRASIFSVVANKTRENDSGIYRFLSYSKFNDPTYDPFHAIRGKEIKV